MTAQPAVRAAEELAAAKRRYELVAGAAKAGFGPETKGAERKAKATELRAAGCLLDDIAALFGVSRERIRQILGLAKRQPRSTVAI